MIHLILSIVAILTVGVIYGVDMFHALVGKKATALSSDASVADLVGHTHFVADKRMPFIGITGIISALLLTILDSNIYAGIAVVALLSHLAIYFTVAKPVNTLMTAAALEKITPAGIRKLQQRWDSVIVYRAILLTIAMVTLLIASR